MALEPRYGSRERYLVFGAVLRFKRPFVASVWSRASVVASGVGAVLRFKREVVILEPCRGLTDGWSLVVLEPCFSCWCLEPCFGLRDALLVVLEPWFGLRGSSLLVFGAVPRLLLVVLELCFGLRERLVVGAVLRFNRLVVVGGAGAVLQLLVFGAVLRCKGCIVGGVGAVLWFKRGVGGGVWSRAWVSERCCWCWNRASVVAVWSRAAV